MKKTFVMSKFVLAAICLIAYGQKGIAKIPEPDNIFYGLPGPNVHSVTLQVDDEILYSYSIGSNPEAGFFYILKIPIDALNPQKPGTARPGDEATIHINDEPDSVKTVTILERGAVLRLDLTPILDDSDGDGLSDAEETALGTNPYNPDTDGDGLSDGAEVANNTDPLNPDSDNDGLSDGDEIAAATDPTVPDVRLVLKGGLNLVSLPIDFMQERTSADLLAELGPAAERIGRLDPSTNTIEYTTMNGDNPEGTVFPLAVGEGYFITMTEASDLLWTGMATESTADLYSGINVVGFSSVPSEYDAFQLLQHIGNPDKVASIRRFSLETGRYETAVYSAGNASGVNFRIRRGDAYLISMKQDAPGFELP